MATLTESTLLKAVAAKMDLDSSDSLGDYTADDKNEILVWAEDCLKWLVPLAPEYMVTQMAPATTTDETPPYAIPSGTLKILRVSHHDDGDELTYKSPAEFQAIKGAYGSNTDCYGEGFRIWSDIMGSITCFRLGGSDTIDVDRLISPSWSGTTPDRELSIPVGWEGTVADYCVVQAKMQDEEPSQAKLIWEMYLQTLSRFEGFENIPKSVGG